MVVNCVAFGCYNEHYSKKPISYHGFPFKRPEVLKRWVEAIRRENWWPSSSSRICGEHFLPSDYQDRPGYKVKLLKPSAVPSVFCFSNYPSENGTPPRQTMQDMSTDVKEEPLDTESHLSAVDLADLPSTSTRSPQQETQTGTHDTNEVSQKIHQETQTYETNRHSQMQIHQGTQTRTCDINKVPRLKREIKTLKQNLKRKNLAISNMKSRIKEISTGVYSNPNLDLQTVDSHYIYVSKCPIT